MNIFEDHPIVLSIIKDLGAILNTVSTAWVTFNWARQPCFDVAKNFSVSGKVVQLHSHPFFQFS